MQKITLAQLRFADWLRIGELVAWPQGSGEPLALTEKLVEQRHEISGTRLFFGLSQSNTLQPELADHFRFLALNGAGTSRRVMHLADVVQIGRAHV